MRGLFIIFISSFITKLWAQCPVADFSALSAACINQQLEFTNLSTGASSYEWDFCSGDLAITPLAEIAASDNLLFRTRSIRIVKQGALWYGFAIDESSSPNRLIRFNFGNDLKNNPTVVDLGNPSGSLAGARDFRMYQEGNQWYALVANSGANTLLRFDFGSNIESTPTVLNLGSFGTLNTPSGILLISDNGTLSAFVSNGAAAEIIRLDFGNSILNTPVATSFLVPGGLNLRGLSIIRECDRWFGLVASFGNNKLFWMDFTDGLLQAPQTGEVTFFTAFNFPVSIVLALDGSEYYAFIQSALGIVYRLSFGSSVIDKNGVGINLGNLGISNENSALDMVKVDSDWYGFSIDLANRRLVRQTFPLSCDATNATSFTQHPPLIAYAGGGQKKITLKTTNASGAVSSITKIIDISAILAPDISISSQNICANHDINFTSQNTSGDIIDYNWDFGDTNSSTQQNPVHQYTTAASYDVSLQVTASNGCNNLARESITVFNEPVPAFDLPAAAPICTNQEYLFANTSTFDASSNPTWQWEVNGSQVSTSEDLSFFISSATPQNVKLIVSLPGCDNEITQTINTVEVGPLADFAFSDNCEGTVIDFTNTTVGDATGFNWDFGDGNSSSQTDGVNTYAGFGNFDVTLQVTNTAGCLNSIVKPITIYSLPQPAFSLDLPPFSCSGSPSQFNDLTPNPTDSNLTGWAWDFGDGGSSSVRNATHTYSAAGSVDVTLQVTTNFGCQAAVQQSVNIAPSPLANFIFDPACVGLPTSFSDASDPLATSWQWKIENTIYTQQNPTHVFNTSGLFAAELTITGTNGCLTTIVKTVDVPVVPAMDFEWTKNCAGQPSLFTDITPLINDPVVSRLWTFSTLGTAAGSPAEFTFNNTGNQPVSLMATYGSGCSYSVAKNVPVVNAPLASFTATPEFGIPPLTVQFANTTNNVVSQLWTFGDANNSTSTALLPSFTYEQSGSFNAGLTVFDDQGCSDTAEKTIVVANPNLDIELTDLQLTPTSSGEIIISFVVTNKSNFQVSNLELLIDLTGEATLKETINITLLPGQSAFRLLSTGIVSIKNQVGYLCLEVLSSGDIDLSNNKQCKTLGAAIAVFDPFPNPSGDLLHLEWVAQNTGNATASLFDAQGKVVFSQSLTGFAVGLNRLTIPLSGINPGTYFVLFVAPGTRKSFPVIVKR